MYQELSEQELLRRESLKQLHELGIDPYPAAEYPVNTYIETIKSEYKPELNNFQDVTISGRIMGRRIMGAAAFVELQDTTGRIQVYFKRDDLCTGEDKTIYNTVFKKLLDIGDIIGIKGFAFITQMGELTIHAREFTLLTKSLKPLPIAKEKDGKVYDAFTDPEQRYRNRTLDLIVNHEVRKTFRQRSSMVQLMREFLLKKGILEVETPILQPLYGGAAARPFKTFHNTLNTTLYLRIANELYLKRLIAGGFDAVFEFAKDFRNEGMDRFHNPEFTQMELYVAYKDYVWMMGLVEEMVEYIALNLHGTTEIKVGENIINFKRPWKRLTMFDAIREYTGIDISEMNENGLRKVCSDIGIEINDTMGKGKLIDEIFGEKVEPLLIQPTFIMDYPVEMSPLAKKHRSKEGLVERFEAIVNSKELCNAYSELNDPLDQRRRFEEQLELGKRGDEEAMMLDEDFLSAIETGMPPTAGLGIGIDRLAMVMTNSQSIQDVLFFPQMKPEIRSTAVNQTDLAEKGIPADWIPVLNKLGILTFEQLKAANPNKLFNDMGGMRKKLKLEITMPGIDVLKSWINQ